jgi:imidazolonepropionase-like amidohydrolase
MTGDNRRSLSCERGFYRLDGEIGTVQPGKRANLLLLRKDPTQSVGAYDEIVKVVLRGRVIDRAELAANRTADGVGRGTQ